MRLLFLFLVLSAIFAGLTSCQTSGGAGMALSSVQTRAGASDSRGAASQAAIAPKTVSVGGPLKVDIYSPEPDRPKSLFALAAAAPARKAPVLVYVHGGGWIKGERSKVYNLPAWSRSRGYMLVSVDYRPVPSTNVDGQIADVVKGIRWVKANIANYGGDPSRIVIMGHSAGSHLVSMIGVRKLAGPVRGVIANDVQAYDLPEYYRLRNNSMDRVYVKAFGKNPADWVRYSPITYVSKGSGYPPFLILYSRSNYERRKVLATGFAGELKKRGTRVTLFDGRGYTHGTIARDIGRSPAVTGQIERFLTSVWL
jgi:acetyl esterase/lipase